MSVRANDMDQRLLLACAQAGDERTFRRLVEPYRHALEVHLLSDAGIRAGRRGLGAGDAVAGVARARAAWAAPRADRRLGDRRRRAPPGAAGGPGAPFAPLAGGPPPP